MAKIATLLMVALILCSTLTYAARPNSAFSGAILAETQHGGGKGADHGDDHELENIESCKGIGAEECLARRTLAAHIDYIYTQNKGH
ncbi:phytosulfokines 3-like [Alnus glutinosa]|nr:phytosulfokines 3-like [Alnus glutinosa]